VVLVVLGLITQAPESPVPQLPLTTPTPTSATTAPPTSSVAPASVVPAAEPAPPAPATHGRSHVRVCVGHTVRVCS
jgi:hypothetical protein